jgi:hypothetical protein
LNKGCFVVDKKPLSSRQVQVLWMGGFVLVMAYVWIAETYGKPSHWPMMKWDWAIAVLGAWSVWGGQSVRRKLMGQVTAESNAELIASRKWSAAQVVALVSAQVVVLWGVIARMVLGCPRWFAALLHCWHCALDCLETWQRSCHRSVIVGKSPSRVSFLAYKRRAL